MWYRYFIRLKELLLTGWLFFNAKNSLANKMPTSTGEFSLKQWKEVHDFFESGDIPLDKIEPSKLRYDEVQKGHKRIEETVYRLESIFKGERRLTSTLSNEVNILWETNQVNGLCMA